jgi:uncharacterized protein YqjF (DUF2071 family)
VRLPDDDERARLRTPPRERPVMRQIWLHLGFLHWPVDVAALQASLPPGLTVDTWEGVGYVGVVPFTIPLSRTPRLGAPIAPAFHELNVRTYVHRDGRDPGVWFFSLDAASRLAVAGARCAYRLPYFGADMTMTIDDDPVRGAAIDYASRRRRGGAAFRARYRPTGPAAVATPGSREFFLLERYLLYAWNGRALRTARVAHVPYPVQPAIATDVAESVVAAAGLPAPGAPPPIVHYARAVDVKIFRPHGVAMRPSAAAPT